MDKEAIRTVLIRYLHPFSAIDIDSITDAIDALKPTEEEIENYDKEKELGVFHEYRDSIAFENGAEWAKNFKREK